MSDAVRVPGAVSQATREPPPMLAVGTVVWLASELMFFGGLFAAYFTLRGEARTWPPSDVELETAITAVATVILLASSGTMHLAGLAQEREDRAAMKRWLVLTFVLGALFLSNVLREFLTLDFGISTNAYGSMYFLMTGFHGLHVFGGLVLMVVALAVATGSRPLAQRRPAVKSLEYYWHFVDAVWVGLFLTLFVIR